METEKAFKFILAQYLMMKASRNLQEQLQKEKVSLKEINSSLSCVSNVYAYLVNLWILLFISNSVCTKL